MENLGKIVVSFTSYSTPEELIDRLSETHQEVFEEPDEGDRIVLVVPERVRQRLHWPADRAPHVAIFKHDLVFRPPV